MASNRWEYPFRISPSPLRRLWRLALLVGDTPSPGEIRFAHFTNTLFGAPFSAIKKKGKPEFLLSNFPKPFISIALCASYSSDNSSASEATDISFSISFKSCCAPIFVISIFVTQSLIHGSSVFKPLPDKKSLHIIVCFPVIRIVCIKSLYARHSFSCVMSQKIFHRKILRRIGIITAIQNPCQNIAHEPFLLF